MIGIRQGSVASCRCSSRPLIPRKRRSRIKQSSLRSREDQRNSSAEGKISASRPVDITSLLIASAHRSFVVHDNYQPGSLHGAPLQDWHRRAPRTGCGSNVQSRSTVSPPALTGCDESLAPGLLGKRGWRVHFHVRWISRAASRPRNFDFGGDNARGAETLRQRSGLGTDTDPLVGRSDFNVCQKLSL